MVARYIENGRHLPLVEALPDERLVASPAENGLATGVCAPNSAPYYNRVKAYGRLDFAIGYQVTPQLSVSFNANNLTGAKYYSYFQNESFPHDIRSDDKFYGLSFNFKL